MCACIVWAAERSGTDVGKQLACGAAGDTVQVACSASDSGKWLPDKFLDEACLVSRTGACTNADVVGASSDKLAVMQARLAWVRMRWCRRRR